MQNQLDLNYPSLGMDLSDPIRRDTQSDETPGVAMHRGSCFWSAARCVEIRQLGILRIAIEVALSRVVCSQLFLSDPESRW